MVRFIRKLVKDRRGNALAMVGAGLPLLIGAAGLATDTIQWTLWKRQLQRAADSAAVAGVYTRVQTKSTDGVDEVVDHDLELNQHTGIGLEATYPKVTFPADDGDMRNQVRVELAVRRRLPFSALFLSTAPLIRANATAASVPGAAEYCVIALDPSAAVTGIEITGSTNLDLGDCSLIANSTNPNTAASNGNSGAGGEGSSIKAKSLAAAGGVKYSSSWDVDSYDPYSTAVEDPYDDLTPPTSCDETITVGKKDFPLDRESTDTNANKVVCINGGLTVQGVAKLGRATYVINGGDLVMNSTGTSLSCTGCTVIMSNMSDPTKTGSIKLTGGTLDLQAPTMDSGANYAGIALYQDDRAIDTGKKTQNQINGNNGASITGVIYIPNQSLLYNGGGNTAACTQLVAKRLEFSGNSAIQISGMCGNRLPPGTGGGFLIRLVA